MSIEIVFKLQCLYAEYNIFIQEQGSKLLEKNAPFENILQVQYIATQNVLLLQI